MNEIWYLGCIGVCVYIYIFFRPRRKILMSAAQSGEVEVVAQMHMVNDHMRRALLRGDPQMLRAPARASKPLPDVKR